MAAPLRMEMPSLLETSFNGNGVLPYDVQASPDELIASWLVTGTGLTVPNWAPAWRKTLAENLKIVAELFVKAGGVREIWVDGSFVEDNPAPGDIDGYFVLDDPKEWRNRAFVTRLAQLDKPGTWSWKPADRRKCRSSEQKPPFWCEYRVELYPDTGLPSDIIGEHGSFLTYPQAFRQRADTFETKGIIRLNLDGLPSQGRQHLSLVPTL